jgi:hypothetical protein
MAPHSKRRLLRRCMIALLASWQYACYGGRMFNHGKRGRHQALPHGHVRQATHGYNIPPQADAGWIGEAGPGPSYMDKYCGGLEADFSNRNTIFMAWNLMHMARTLKEAGGITAHGNQTSAWEAGCRFDFPNPEHRYPSQRNCADN